MRRALAAAILLAALGACTGDGSARPAAKAPAAEPGISVSGYARVGVVRGG